MQKKYILIISLSILVLGIYFYFQNSKKTSIPQNKNAYLNHLKTENDFLNFGGDPLDNSLNNIVCVKVVYDINRKKIFFINSNQYQLHYTFCSEILKYKFGLGVFNASNYSKNNNRDFYLANLNLIKSSHQYCLEFTDVDEIDSSAIVKMFTIVQQNCFVGQHLKLLLNNSNTIQYFSKQNVIPTYNLELLWALQNYQAIQLGTSIGRLNICDNLKKDKWNIEADDIIIIHGTPTSLPHCKGIITDAFQTPLSHIQILSHNKKITSASLKNIFENKGLQALEDKIIKLEVKKDTINISLASPAEASHYSNKFDNKPIHLKSNTNIIDILPIALCKNLTAADIGNKALGFRDLEIIATQNKNLFSVPKGGFVIPFFYYKQHIADDTISRLIKLLEHKNLSKQETKAHLKWIRKAIISKPIDANLLKSITEVILKNNCGNRYRFRSSCNAEDLENFSGAGLYNSKTGILNDNKTSIAKAIKQVWASVYTNRAYQERRLANINESGVMMAVLSHQNFPNESINGVAISKNIYRAEFSSYTINAQLGDAKTVSPKDSTVCEQLLISKASSMNPLSKKIAAKYIQFSNQHPQGSIFNEVQLNVLYKSIEAIEKYYDQKMPNKDWDLEFKFDKDKLIIKQVRPY